MTQPNYGPFGKIGPAVGFTWNEVRCTDGTLPNDAEFRWEAVRQARRLNVLRKRISVRFGVPFNAVSIIVNSWYRSYAYNRKIGGAKASRHVWQPHGDATDLRVRVTLKTGRRVTLHPRFVAALAAAYVPEFANGGIGWYDAEHGWFTHLDNGPKRRWINVG